MPKSQHEPRWFKENCLPMRLPRELHQWLFDKDSLTLRLMAVTAGTLKVQKISQEWQAVGIEYAKILGVQITHHVLIREVVLIGAGKNLVYGRTLIPYSSLVGKLRFLKYLCSRPLGAYLFKQKSLQRRSIEIAYLQPHHTLFKKMQSHLPLEVTGCWIRRSLFEVCDLPLIVLEGFMPDLFSLQAKI